MKGRKLLALLLVMALCVGLLAGCGSSSSSSANNENETPASSSDSAEEENAAAPEEQADAITDEVETALNAKEPNNGDHYVVAYSAIAYSVAAYTTFLGDYLKEQVEAMGWEFTYLAAEGDVELQAEQVETLCNQNPDILIVYAGDASLVPIYLQDANDKDIPVLLVMCTVDDEYKDMAIGFIGTDQYDISYVEATRMIERYGADNDVLIVSVSGVESQQDYQDKLAGFLAALIDNGCLNEDGSANTWTFVGPEWCLSSRETAQAAMENYIQIYGDSITAVIGFDDDLTMGCVNAIQAEGMGDSIEVWSQMGMIEMINAIRNGEAYYTIYLPAETNAGAAVQAVSDYLTKGSLDSWQIAPEYFEISPENCYDYDGDF